MDKHNECQKEGETTANSSRRFCVENLDPRVQLLMEEFSKAIGLSEEKETPTDKASDSASAPANAAMPPSAPLEEDMDPHAMMVGVVKGVEQAAVVMFARLFLDAQNTKKKEEGAAGEKDRHPGKCEREGESEVFIDGLEDDEPKVRLEVFRPVAKKDKPRPCLVYLHGGGMAMLSVNDYRPYLRYLCDCGFVVVAPEFRNSTEVSFPGGLNDCLAAVKWADSQREKLNTSCVLVGGESGGGNLAAAVCLLAKKRGETPVDGQYLNCPFLNHDPHRFPSLAKSRALSPNMDTAVLDTMENAMKTLYTPTEEGKADPIAWPINADTETLTGIPPALIVVNELDGLRDEGEAFYRNLLNAGVSAQCFSIGGTGHGHCLATGVIPDIAESTVHLVKCFAKQIAKQRNQKIEY